MSKSNLYLTITNGVWLIEPSAINQFGPIVKSLISNGAIESDNKTEHSAMIIGASGAVSFSKYGDGFNVTEPGSTAVINISGAIMKQDNCGDPGTETIARIVNEADKNPNISSIVLVIDSPGGTVAGTEHLATTIKQSKTPIVAFVDGMMASAAYWIGSSASEIYANAKTDMIGSIGTMMSFADAQPVWEKQGVVFHEIYADASKDKNKDFIEARKGNYAKVKEKLNAINDVFVESVIANRGDKLNQKETLSGKVFMAEEAINNGLIDGFKNMNDVIARAQELGAKKNQSNNQTQIQNNMKIKAAWGAMIAFLTTTFTSIKAEDTLTEEHLEKMNTELATLADTKAALEKVNADLKAANDLAAAKSKELETAIAEKTKLSDEVARLSALNPGATTTVKTEGGDSNATSESFEDVAKEMEHNKAVDNNPLFNHGN